MIRLQRSEIYFKPIDWSATNALFRVTRFPVEKFEGMRPAPVVRPSVLRKMSRGQHQELVSPCMPVLPGFPELLDLVGGEDATEIVEEPGAAHGEVRVRGRELCHFVPDGLFVHRC